MNVKKIAHELFVEKVRKDRVLKKLVNPRLKLLLTTIDEVKVYLVDAKEAAFYDTRWMLKEHALLGNHNWGNYGEYIEENEIWISNNVKNEDLRRVIFHELLERDYCIAKQFSTNFSHSLVRLAEKNIDEIHKINPPGTPEEAY